MNVSTNTLLFFVYVLSTFFVQMLITATWFCPHRWASFFYQLPPSGAISGHACWIPSCLFFFLWYLQSSTCNGQWRSVFRCIWAGEWNHLWFNAHRAEHLHWNNNSDRSTFSAELFCMGQCTWAPAPASSLHTQGPALSFYLILRLLTPHPGPIIFFFHGRSKLGLRPPFLPPALLSVTGIVWSRCSGIGDKHMIINKMLTHLYFSSLGYFWQTEAWLSLSIYQDCVITLLTSLNKWPKPVGFKS